MTVTFSYTDKHGETLTITPNTEWVNYGDMNPRIHGGMWVQWDRDMWHIITTVHPEGLPSDMVDNEHMIEHTWVEPSDLFKNGNPDNGATDTFERILESLSTGYVTALVDYDIEYFVADFNHWIHSGDTDYIDDSNYWDYLCDYGITQE